MMLANEGEDSYNSRIKQARPVAAARSTITIYSKQQYSNTDFMAVYLMFYPNRL
jgi:hypothetical protein